MNPTVGWRDWSVVDRRIVFPGHELDLSADRIRLVGGCSGLAPFRLSLVVNGVGVALTEPDHGLLCPPSQLAALATALGTIDAEPQQAIAEQLNQVVTQGVLSLVNRAAPTPNRSHLSQDDPVDRFAAVTSTGARIAITITGGLVIRPVLVISGPGSTTTVDLAHPTTGSVQPADRLTALATLVEATGTGEATLAAEQIRQLATWERIDEQYQLAIDIGTGPTPDLSDTASSLANPKPLFITTIRQARRHLARLIVLPPLAILMLAGAHTCATLTEEHHDGGVTRTGTALVTACHTDGPISRQGLGYLSTCAIDIAWSDGTAQTRSAGHSLFSADEIGTRVGIAELRVACPLNCHDVLIRWPERSNGWYGLAALVLIVLALAALAAANTSRRALRHWRRTRRRGQPATPEPATGTVIHLTDLYLAARRESPTIRTCLAVELRPDQGTVTFPREYPIYLADARIRLTTSVVDALQAEVNLELDGQTLKLIDPFDGFPRPPEELAALAAAIRDTGIPEHRRVADLIDTLRHRGILGLLPPEQPPATVNDDSDLAAARRRYQYTIWLGGLRLYIAIAMIALAADGCWQLSKFTDLYNPPDLRVILALPLALWLGWKSTRATLRRLRRMLRPPVIDGDHIRYQGRWTSLAASACHLTIIGGPKRWLGWFGPWPLFPALMVDPGIGPMITVPLADPATGSVLPPTELIRLAGLLTDQPTTDRDLHALTQWKRLPHISDSTLNQV